MVDIQIISTGGRPNDGLGDSPRASWIKQNANNQELSAAASDAKAAAESALATAQALTASLAVPAPRRFAGALGNLVAGQTNLVVPPYTAGPTMLFRGGLKLPPSAYAAPGGTTVTLADPAAADDEFEWFAWLMQGALTEGSYLAFHASLPVWSGSGPPPVASGKAYRAAAGGPILVAP